MIKSKKEKVPNPYPRWVVIRARIILVLILGPLIYSLLWYFGSPWVNAYWQKTEQCTIDSVTTVSAGARSYSSNDYVWMKSSECIGLRYSGPSYGLTDQEIAKKIDDQVVGKKVNVKTGIWQMPRKWDSGDVYSIEGLDLDR